MKIILFHSYVIKTFIIKYCGRVLNQKKIYVIRTTKDKKRCRISCITEKVNDIDEEEISEILEVLAEYQLSYAQ
jgi:hypothetical protein